MLLFGDESQIKFMNLLLFAISEALLLVEGLETVDLDLLVSLLLFLLFVTPSILFLIAFRSSKSPAEAPIGDINKIRGIINFPILYITFSSYCYLPEA